MTINHFIEELRKAFLRDRIQHKNGWGKNEIEYEFEKAISEVLFHYLDGNHV